MKGLFRLEMVLVALATLGVAQADVCLPVGEGELNRVLSVASAFGGTAKLSGDYDCRSSIAFRGNVGLVGDGHMLRVANLDDDDFALVEENAKCPISDVCIVADGCRNLCGFVGTGSIVFGPQVSMNGFSEDLRLFGHGEASVGAGASLSNVRLFEDASLVLLGGEVSNVVCRGRAKISILQGSLNRVVLYDASSLEILGDKLPTCCLFASDKCRIDLSGFGDAVSESKIVLTTIPGGHIEVNNLKLPLGIIVSAVEEECGQGRVELILAVDPTVSLAPVITSFAWHDGRIALTVDHGCPSELYRLCGAHSLEKPIQWHQIIDAQADVSGKAEISALVGDYRFFRIVVGEGRSDDE